MTTVWKIEFGRLAGVVGASLLAAMLTGFWSLSFLGGLTLYIIWHLRQMRRVERWLINGGSPNNAPDAGGVWEQLVNHVYRLQQRNRRRKKRLSDIVNRFHRSTEAMPDAAVVLRDGGVIEWSNRAARDLLGIRNPQDHGQRIDNLLRDPAFRDYLAAGDFDESLDMSSPVDEEVELNVRVVGYGARQYLLMARDASSIRRVEAVRRDFVANVSHELRTPLTVVTGYLESFDHDPLPDYVREGIDAIDRQARRMLSIVEDLLTLSKLEMEPVDPAAAETVDVPALLATVVRDAQHLSGERGHVIELDATPGMGLRGMGGELNSAFSNLVANAVQHTPPGTRIRVIWRADRDGARMAVADEGQGIGPKHLPRLTERFYRVDTGRSRARGGTGLGLSVVKHVLVRNGGELDIQSTPARGSTFACLFPGERVVALSDVDPEAVRAPRAGAGRGGQRSDRCP